MAFIRVLLLSAWKTETDLVFVLSNLQSIATRPTDKEFYDSLSPALKRRVDAQRSQDDRHQAYKDQLKVSYPIKRERYIS